MNIEYKTDYTFLELCNVLKKLNNAIFIEHTYNFIQLVNNSTGEVLSICDNASFNELIKYKDWLKEVYKTDFELALKHIKNNYAKRRRTFYRIYNMYEESLKYNFHFIFLTFTFTDKTLNSTSAKTRRVYISRWLKKYTLDYICNYDTGKLYEREHYHAVVISREKFDYSTYKLGAIKFIKCYIKNDNVKSLSKYLIKLTNHATKDTAIKDNQYILTGRKYNYKKEYNFFNF